MGQTLTADPNKQGAGNAGPVPRRSAARAGRVLSAGEVANSGEVLAGGDPARPARPDRGDLVRLPKARGRIGGFLRFGGCSIGQVRMAKSEWPGQGLGFAGFTGRTDQPDRLTRGAGLVDAAGPEGLDPPGRAPTLPLPVAASRSQSGAKCRAETQPISLCKALSEAEKMREIPSIRLGLGVRAAHCAGVSDRTMCRPKSPENGGLTEGLGDKSARSCAKSVSEAGRLGGGTGSVNQRA